MGVIESLDVFLQEVSGLLLICLLLLILVAFVVAPIAVIVGAVMLTVRLLYRGGGDKTTEIAEKLGLEMKKTEDVLGSGKVAVCGGAEISVSDNSTSIFFPSKKRLDFVIGTGEFIPEKKRNGKVLEEVFDAGKSLNFLGKNQENIKKVSRLAEKRGFQVYFFEGGFRVYVEREMEAGEVSKLMKLSEKMFQTL